MSDEARCEYCGRLRETVWSEDGGPRCLRDEACLLRGVERQKLRADTAEAELAKWRAPGWGPGEYTEALEDEFAAGRDEGRREIDRYREAWLACRAAALSLIESTLRHDYVRDACGCGRCAALDLDPEKAAESGEETTDD